MDRYEDSSHQDIDTDTKHPTLNVQDIPDDLFPIFVGKNMEKYAPRFRHFVESGRSQFSPTWHWPAFFLGPFWFLYRKMYLWAIVTLVVDFVPAFGILSRFLWGMCAHYFYHVHVTGSILELGRRHAHTSEEEFDSILAKKGGVNAWVWGLALIPVIGILSAIAIPQFSDYRSRSYDSQAKRAVEYVMAAQKRYYEENGSYAEKVALLRPYFKEGRPDPKVSLAILSADAENFTVEGFHPDSGLLYTANALASKPQSTTHKGRDLFDSEKWCKLTVPDDWTRMSDLYAGADIQAGNSDKDMYLIVLVEDRTDFFGIDPESLTELSTTGFEDFLLDVETTKKETRINGRKALQHTITGTLPETRVNVTYIQTVIQGRRAFYQILAWTSEDNYQKNRAVLEDVPLRFVEL